LTAFVQSYLDNVNAYVDETGDIEALPDVLAKSRADLAAALNERLSSLLDAPARSWDRAGASPRTGLRVRP
jgi:hypothetical protein